MKHDLRGAVIDYLKVHSQIPRDSKNDPHFSSLEETLSVFSSEEVVLMVNRFLYQMEYQRSWHRKMERDKQEKLEPLKDKVKELFGVSWTKATDKQIREANAQLLAEKQTKE